MSSAEAVSFELHYGSNQSLVCNISADRIVGGHQPPVPAGDVPGLVREALSSPLDGPPLNRAIIESDHVILALDPETPAAALIVAGIVEHLLPTGLAPENLLILQPRIASRRGPGTDPRTELPAEIRSLVRWKEHDPGDETGCAYLATTSSGERIYLARELIEADVVVTVGRAAFDPVMGYRGTSSVLFPGLSNVDAGRRSHGQGHTELAPENDRPLRQMVDEIGWLLGSMFTVQVMPSVAGQVAQVLAGSVDSVHRAACRALSDAWRVSIPERAATVVIAIDADAAGHSWNQLGSALAAARSLVMQGGRIIVLSEINSSPGIGMNMLRGAMEPADAIKPLRLEKPDDVVAATELAQAVDWATVYLISQLEADLVEELFMIPLSDQSEVHRLLERSGTCVFLHSAQNCYGEIVD